MQVKINQKDYQFSKSPTINEMLQELEMNQQSGIAIAINSEVISKNKWESIQLNDQDDILIITATQGG